MAVVFGNLCAIKRGNQVFYCVPEARKKLFSGVSDIALIDWITFSSFHILKASDDEIRILEKQLMGEPGPSTLISEGDLIRLFNLNSHPSTGTLHSFQLPPFILCEISTVAVGGLQNNSDDSTTTMDSQNDNLVQTLDTIVSFRSQSEGHTTGFARPDHCTANSNSSSK